MSFQMYDGLVTVNVDRTPLALDEVTRTLYNRAITNPSSLTDTERRSITRRPPQQEEDDLCRNRCGLSFSEVVSKATRNRDSLTYQEAHLVVAGVVDGQVGRLLNERVRLGEADRDLTHKASDAATTQDLKDAQANARAVDQKLSDASAAASNFLNDDDQRNIRYAMHVPWQEHVLSLTEAAVCGLVIFFPDVPEWPSYKEQIQTAVQHGLHCTKTLVKESAIAKFALHWVEDDDTGDLRDRFASMRDSNEFPVGLRRDSFLYVDQDALQSCDAPRPFVWLLEPENENTAKPLKVHINHIAPTLFARLTQRDLSPEANRRPYRNTSELKMLHKAARWSKDASGEKDGIWPPPVRFM
jgi:hypothetical protein